MKRNGIRVLLAMTVVSMLLINVACGSSTPVKTGETGQATTKSDEVKAADTAKEEVKISWLTSQAKFKDVYKDMASQLQKDENISVDFQVIPDDQFYNLVKAKLATSEVPDVIEYNTPTSNAELNADKNCLDLGNEPWVSRLTNPTILKDAKDGKIYAMPKESGSFFGAVYYNKKIMKDLGIDESQPQTYGDFVSKLEQIKVKGAGKVVPFYAANKDSWTTQIFMTLGFTLATFPNDKDIWTKLLENKSKWSDIPEFKKILADYKALYTNGYVNKDNLSASYDMSKEAVAVGKAAMILNGEWAVSDIMAKWPDVELGSWIIPFNDKLIMGTGAYVQGLFVPKAGKNTEAAKNFLNLWSQPKYQNILYQKYPGFPGFNDVDGGKVAPCVSDLVEKYIKTNKYANQMNDQMAIASPIWGDLWKLYIEMTTGQKTPEQLLQSWDKIYADYMKQKQQPGF